MSSPLALGAYAAVQVDVQLTAAQFQTARGLARPHLVPGICTSRPRAAGPEGRGPGGDGSVTTTTKDKESRTATSSQVVKCRAIDRAPALWSCAEYQLYVALSALYL